MWITLVGNNSDNTVTGFFDDNFKNKYDGTFTSVHCQFHAFNFLSKAFKYSAYLMKTAITAIPMYLQVLNILLSQYQSWRAARLHS